MKRNRTQMLLNCQLVFFGKLIGNKLNIFFNLYVHYFYYYYPYAILAFFTLLSILFE